MKIKEMMKENEEQNYINEINQSDNNKEDDLEENKSENYE